MRKCKVFPVEFVGAGPFKADIGARPSRARKQLCLFRLPNRLEARVDHALFAWAEGLGLSCSRLLPTVCLCAVRGYLTGSTSTSIWTQYAKGYAPKPLA